MSKGEARLLLHSSKRNVRQRAVHLHLIVMCLVDEMTRLGKTRVHFGLVTGEFDDQVLMG